MELTTTQTELAAIAAPTAGSSASGRGGCPLENPDVPPITEEMLLPHPGEPGVRADGTASPLENPGSGLV